MSMTFKNGDCCPFCDNGILELVTRETSFPNMITGKMFTYTHDLLECDDCNEAIIVDEESFNTAAKEFDKTEYKSAMQMADDLMDAMDEEKVLELVELAKKIEKYEYFQNWVSEHTRGK